MQLPNVVGLMNVGKSFVKANRPEIMLGASLAASIGSTVMAAIGGFRSGKQVAALELVKGEPLTKTEIVSETWTNYAPAGGMLVGAVASTVGLHAVHIKEKKAIIATALAAVEEVRSEAKAYIETLNESVEDHTTEKGREKIRQAVLEKSADRNGGIAKIMSSDGLITELYICRDARTGRDIWSNDQSVREALLEVQTELSRHGEAPLNMFYSHVGLNDIPDGEDYGWFGSDKISMEWSASVRDDGRPVRVFAFNPEPTKGYDKSR